MSNYTYVKKLLEREPIARERSRRADYIVAMLIEDRFSVTLSEVHRRSIVEICKEYSSLERAWREVEMNEVDLRGSDYELGKELEQEKIIELGYEPSRKIHA